MKFLPSLFLFKIALKILLDKVLKTKLSLLVDKKYLVYKALFFYPEYKKKTFFLLILPKKKNKGGKWPFLDKNHGLTTLENFEFFHFFKPLFFLSRKHSILSRIMPNSFCLILQKKQPWKVTIFWQTPWTNPFGNWISNFFTSYKLHFSYVENILFYPEYGKSVLFVLFSAKKKS